MDSESLVLREYSPKMEDFDPAVWARLYPKERLALLQYAEDQMAIQEGRMPRKVTPRKMDEDGLYDINDHLKIFINEDVICMTEEDALRADNIWSSFEALNTVYHEGRHAYQDDYVNGRLLKIKQENKVEADTLRQWMMQISEYVYNEPPDTGRDVCSKKYLEYYFQSVELDANEFALKQMKSLAQSLDIPGLSSYLENEEDWHRILGDGAALFWGPDFKKAIADDIKKRYNEECQQACQETNEQNAFASVKRGPHQGKEKKKLSPLQFAILGGTLLWLLIMYLIAKPSGLLRHLLWIISAVIPFVPAIWLLRAKPGLRNKKGGILLLAIFAVLLLLIQKLYFWLSVAYVVVGTLFLLKSFSNIMPNTLTIIREEADGTTSTETRIIGDNVAQEIAAADAQLRSEGYTKVK